MISACEGVQGICSVPICVQQEVTHRSSTAQKELLRRERNLNNACERSLKDTLSKNFTTSISSCPRDQFDAVASVCQLFVHNGIENVIFSSM